MAKSAKPLTFEDLDLINQIQMGLKFVPETNLNSPRSYQRTVSAYINNAKRSSSQR